MIKLSVYLVAIFIFILTGLAPLGGIFAQESPISTSIPNVRQIQERFRQEIKGLKEEFKGTREEQKSELKSLRNTTKGDIERRKEELKRLQEQRKEEFNVRLKERKNKVKEEIESKRAELKEKLQNIRDERKKKIVERVAQQLNELNKRMADYFSQVLEKLDKVLVNIESRANKAKSRGWDVMAVGTMITVAKEAIATARAAVEAQAAKIYTPEITGEEEKLRVEVGEARQALHNDLAAVRETIRAAFEAVRRVATTLAQIPRVDEEPEENPTVSPSPSPSPTP